MFSNVVCLNVLTCRLPKCSQMSSAKMFSNVVCLFYGFLGPIAINNLESKNLCRVASACDIKTGLQNRFEKNMFDQKDYNDPVFPIKVNQINLNDLN